MATIQHSSVTKEQLVNLAAAIPGAWIGLKIASLLLVLEGQRSGWIAEVLGINRMNLSRWVRAVNKKGLEAIREKPKLGKVGQLTPALAKQLEAHLERKPLDFGIPRSRWDGPTFAVHLKRQFGVKLKVRQAQKWLHQLGYRFKRASYVYLQAKAQDALRFKKRLKKTEVAEKGRDAGLPG